MSILIPLAVAMSALAIAVAAGMTRSGHTTGFATAPGNRAERELPGTGRSSPSGVLQVTQRSTGCHIDYGVTDWSGQFVAQVTLTNTGTRSIDGWNLTFVFPGDQAISSGWNAHFTQTGHRVTATNTDHYDAVIQPRAQRSLGFLGTWASKDTDPSEFDVNGTPCT